MFKSLLKLQKHESPSTESPSPPSQYDTIGSKYKVIKSLPTALVEKSSLHAAIAPLIPNARVLDLACGTGFFTRLLLEWGAASVVGVDLSPAMISAAVSEARSLPPHTAQRMDFRVGDATTLGKIEDAAGKGFDHAIGAWLLHYAADENELTAMFSTISANLNSPASVFVGIAARPVARKDMDACAEKLNGERAQGWLREHLRAVTSYYERMADGEGEWKVQVTSTENPEVSFRNCHLPMEVYERAARRGGMLGKLGWREVKLHEDVREEAIREFGQEFWDVYFDIGPHFGLLVVEKGGE
ncbi:putative methyltransferase [Podospora aff. communis PSN243]|uniref:Methyltransferase n=1 Tax=Podospora aff. communis PSN243 TaxID=3040156 RepID=A0AAV9GTJ5_9PEZI|nr:putative methyltransferase [Podospora aff. communis PSN243]